MHTEKITETMDVCEINILLDTIPNNPVKAKSCNHR